MGKWDTDFLLLLTTISVTKNVGTKANEQEMRVSNKKVIITDRPTNGGQNAYNQIWMEGKETSILWDAFESHYTNMSATA